MDRRQFLQAIAGSIALGSLLPAVADEPKSAALMQTLPPDGAWATFNVNVKVSWQRGELECAVISGQNELEFGVVKLNMTHRVFRHRDVPFGIAGMQQELKASFGGQEEKVAIRMSLRDHGKDAKAKLSDLFP